MDVERWFECATVQVVHFVEMECICHECQHWWITSSPTSTSSSHPRPRAGTSPSRRSLSTLPFYPPMAALCCDRFSRRRTWTDLIVSCSFHAAKSAYLNVKEAVNSVDEARSKLSTLQACLIEVNEFVSSLFSSFIALTMCVYAWPRWCRPIAELRTFFESNLSHYSEVTGTFDVCVLLSALYVCLSLSPCLYVCFYMILRSAHPPVRELTIVWCEWLESTGLGERFTRVCAC